MKMNKKQYNNIIEHSLQYDCKDTESSLDTARIVFNNMGVALPNGTQKEVYDIISTNEYMGWRKCTLEKAKEAANNGTAAIGISEDKIVILSAEDEEQPAPQTASVLTLTDNTPAVAVADMAYYTYSYDTTNENYFYFSNSNMEVDVGWSGYNSLVGSTISSTYWQSSNSSIAEVDSYGYITTHKCGTVMIRAYTYNGLCGATFQLTINPDYRHVETSKGFTWVVNEGGIASFIVDFSLSCKVVEAYNDMVKIERISAFIYTDKNPYALLEPDLSVGTTTLGNTTLNMGEQEALWLDPNWIWGHGLCTLNAYVSKGTVLRSLGIAMTADSPYGYREIELEMTI